jgi:type VI secretion system protein ImpE
MMPTHESIPLRLSHLTAEHRLQDALAHLESEVRRQPGSADHRWALAEMLCVLGQWERALKHLQISARLAGGEDVQWHSKAQMLRGLIVAEAQRVEVFEGRATASPVIDTPVWMQDLGRALASNARGEHGEADRLRRSALDGAPTQPVICAWCDTPTTDASAEAGEPLTEAQFDWIGDSDTRLGPVCEFIAASGYRWLAFADIAELRMERPHSLLDLVWRPVTLRLRASTAGAQLLRGFVPTRYSGTERLPPHSEGARCDALLLARLTEWQEVGDTGIFAVGQKTWMTDAGDMPLLGLRSLRLASAVADAGGRP